MLHVVTEIFKNQVQFDFIGYNITSSARDGTEASVLTYHRIIEAFKFAYARRGQLGDPAFNRSINEVNEKTFFPTLFLVAP